MVVSIPALIPTLCVIYHSLKAIIKCIDKVNLVTISQIMEDRSHFVSGYMCVGFSLDIWEAEEVIESDTHFTELAGLWEICSWGKWTWHKQALDMKVAWCTCWKDNWRTEVDNLSPFSAWFVCRADLFNQKYLLI